MTRRKYALIGFTGLCIAAASVGLAAEPKEDAPLGLTQADATESTCMQEGFDTTNGRVGCFEPVIAIIDPNFFETNAVIVDDEAAAE